MVLYFSGTGNSRYVAQRIASALGDSLLCMNDLIRAQDFSPVFSGQRLVIVTPTYAWRIPRLVRQWLLKMDFPEAEQVWFVMTCGSEIGAAAQYNQSLCQEKRLAYCGTAQIVMPENYIALFSVPQADEARKIVSRAEPCIDRAIACIRAGQALPSPRLRFYDRLMSGPVNPFFYAFIVKDTPFIATDACVGCGRCAQLCPRRNITLADGRPVWHGDCTHCMACICLCPHGAIEYGKKSLGKPRYRFQAP